MKSPLSLYLFEQQLIKWDPITSDKLIFGNEENEKEIYVKIETGMFIHQPIASVISSEYYSLFPQLHHRLCIILTTIFIPDSLRRNGFASLIVSMLEKKSSDTRLDFAISPIISNEMKLLIEKRKSKSYKPVAPFGYLLSASL